MKTGTLTAFVAAFAAVMASSPVQAQDSITLRFAYPVSANSATWKQWFEPWIERVRTDSGNAVQVQPFFGNTLATMTNSYDRVVSGVADIALGASTSMTGKLKSSTVVELPSDYMSRESSGAMWRLFEQGLIAAEWSDVRPVLFTVYPATAPSFVQPVTRLEDLKGLKIATLTKGDSDIYQLLGAAPVTASVSELYEMANRRVVSGVVAGRNAFLNFKLNEVTSYHLNFEGAGGVGFTIMNKASYEKLPDAGKRALDKNSGFQASQGAGAVTDRSVAAAEEFMKKTPGHTLASLPPAEKQRWIKAIQPVTDQWVKDTPNGAAILAAYRTEVAKVRAQK
jgi:TRAP-type C4-dicarboxylate transport system substrate-binding protein